MAAPYVTLPPQLASVGLQLFHTETHSFSLVIFVPPPSVYVSVTQGTPYPISDVWLTDKIPQIPKYTCKQVLQCQGPPPATTDTEGTKPQHTVPQL